jgi:HPt (histidine-containing phosphotransfer) domain-containing protein
MTQAQAVIDRKALLESMENDAEFLIKVIGIFLADCPAMMGDIRTGVAARDSIRIMTASHALRGSVSQFGAKSAVEAARILESLGRQAKLEGVDEALRVLEREMTMVLLSLKEIAKEVA